MSFKLVPDVLGTTAGAFVAAGATGATVVAVAQPESIKVTINTRVIILKATLLVCIFLFSP
jgi:hypothetical protein